MKKRVSVVCLQIGCFALCFVFCALFMLHISYTNIVTQPTVSVNNGSKKMTVILDPGHGGEDSGAVGIGGIEEKNINLALTGILSDLLSSCGATVIETRTEDVMLGDGSEGHKKQEDLRARVDLGNEYPDAYYVSIHMNKFPEEYCKGIQLFYSPNHQNSLSLATELHKLVLSNLQPDNNREIKNGSEHIYLLDRLRNPAILVECGFISNQQEAQLLSETDYQKKISLLITISLLETEYRNQNA